MALWLKLWEWRLGVHLPFELRQPLLQAAQE